MVIGFSAGRGVVRGYVPLDDNAVIETRARDVLSARIPLLGSVSSASRAGDTVHHPGPMLFDILALPVRLFPQGAGVAIGVGALHIVTVLVLAWCARRLLGDDGACVVVATTAVLMWSLGSDALYEAWQPIVTMLPFLLALVAAWGFGAGADELAIPAVLAVSFVVQTHGSYLVLGPAVLLGAVVHRLAQRSMPALRRRPLVLAAAGGVLVWVQPLAEQLFRAHNMSRLVRRAVSGTDGEALGAADGLRAAAMVLVKPPWWTRPGVSSSLPNGGGLVRTQTGRVFDPDWVSLPVAVVGIAALLAVLMGVGVVGHRAGDRILTGGAAVATSAVAAAVVSLAGLPVDEFGFTAHKARWLWPIGAFVTALLLVALLRRHVVASQRQAGTSMALVGAVALLATLPSSAQLLSPQQYLVDSQDAARQLRNAAGALEDRGDIFLDLSSRPFPDAFNDTLAAEMAARGMEFRVAGDYVAGQYGEDRRLDPNDDVGITARLFVGPGALADVPDNYDVVADIDADPRVVLAITEGLDPVAGAPSG